MKVDAAFATLNEAHGKHKPSAVFSLFSGGHDSLTATSIAFEWSKISGIPVQAAHINTTIGIEETREFVRETCSREGWPLRELFPPRDYESLVMEFGMPGPYMHTLMYNRLKERCLAQLVRENKKHRRDHVMFVSGIRSQESTRRMRHVERIQKEGGRVWAAAIHDWSKFDCMDWLDYKKLPLNPVVLTYHHSGECLCGAFARPGELDEISLWYPKTAERIRELERKVEEGGKQPHACVWGTEPPAVHRDQMKMFPISGAGPLCQSCVADWEEVHA